jgi:hypothetical protein
VKTKIQTKTVFGKILFELEKEDNSIKETLKKAVEEKAHLRGANLHEANLKKLKSQIWIIPEEGSFIAWKKAANNCLVKIEIPAKAKRICNTINRKCRDSYVKTLEIIDSEGKNINEVCGKKDSSIIYKVGRITKPDSFDKNIFEDCSHGIHFFVTKQETIDW